MQSDESVGRLQHLWEHLHVIASIENYFSNDFAAARERFLAACESASLDPVSHAHPQPGPDGDAITTDVARLGPPDADRLLVLISGVHGPELLCGSGCQTGVLESATLANLPLDTAVLFVHAINPWGAAYLRRNTEDNVDLCRNFMQFAQPLPTNPGYADIREAFSVQGSVHEAREAMEYLRRYQQERGVRAFMAALMAGQFSDADGFSFGGRVPTWSNRLLTRLLREHGAQASRIVGLDYHSGLGPYGYGTAVVMHTGEALARARRHFGPWVEAPREAAAGATEEFYAVEGHCADGFVQALPDGEATLVTIEFGTFSPERNLQALVEDHWLAICGQEARADEVKREMQITHFPDDPEWRYAVWTRSQQVVRQALRCLAE